ncbi:MAG: DNA mismatch repair endonuclease MutL [Bacteroidales bacterium]|jgi:DNA mismatch repair protein MutL|nr:DNA mismatch repair endonuclease MutL [Bacteroidales bacterium]
MSDLIRLLPENVANQIAAGEVVQRPASVVKELLENAVDAKASKITLIIKDAGRLLIQVIDNGIGMSETDARLSFERHATSKIHSADDLFKLNTLGFRGEALASIAAVAQVEMKTKKADNELGTKIIIEGSKLVSQEECTCDTGTSISVKNLFFNIPVRRNFLKSNTQELKLIIEEFYKVALINPHIHFAVYNNDNLLYDLIPENFKQRIVNLINKSYKEKLIPLEIDIENIKISGFICKPEHAKKSRGDQYLFVNNRFIKHQYLKHAIESSYQEIIPADMFPMFFIKIDIEPELIDVNIHPTKTEINFQDASTLYSILKSGMKRAFGSFSIQVPSIDFGSTPEFAPITDNRPVVPPNIKLNPNYDPFDGFANVKKNSENNSNWQEFYSELNNQYKNTFGNNDERESDNKSNIESGVLFEKKNEFIFGETFIQFKNKYIIGTINKGIIIIDQQRAHERILFEEYLDKLKKNTPATQIDMFPETITVNFDEALILDETKDLFASIGFMYEKLGKTNYVINSHPENISTDEIKDFFENVLMNLKMETGKIVNDRHTAIAKSMTTRTRIRENTILHNLEMRNIAEKLFKCKISDVDLKGNPTYAIIDMDAVENIL